MLYSWEEMETMSSVTSRERGRGRVETKRQEEVGWLVGWFSVEGRVTK